MKATWGTTAFLDAPIQIIDGDRGKNYPKHTDFSDKGFCVFLNTSNITEAGFAFGDTQFIDETKDEAMRKGKLTREDVVMTTRGTIGNTAYFSAAIPYDHMRINSGMVIFRCDQKQILPQFLYHFLRSPAFHGQVNSLRSGVAQPQLPIRDIKRILIPLPSLVAQSQVSNVLSAYDDLIENNRRRMALLEESARLLYQEWFVSLRFPGHARVKVANGIPEGWKAQILIGICDEIREIVLPEELEPDTPYIGLEHMPRRSISLSEWGKAETVTSNKHKYRKGDIIFGKIRPYFHKVGIAFTDGVASSDAIVIRPKSDKLNSLVLMTVSGDRFVAEASQTMKEGSKMPRADWKHMSTYTVAVPPPGLLSDFNETITVITDQLCNLCFQNQKLKSARDILLPRLMSGEIPV